jgi:hypothetical protein
MHSHLSNGAAKGALTKLVDKETEVLAARRMKRLGRQIDKGTIATMVVILVMAVPLVAGLWVLGGQSAAPVWVSVGLRIDDADPTLPEWFLIGETRGVPEDRPRGSRAGRCLA